MCGVFGAASTNEQVASLIYFGLYALQHRGQESAGMATSCDGAISLYKDMGTIDWVFRKRVPIEDVVSFVLCHKDLPRDDIVRFTRKFEQENEKAALAHLPGNVGIGHVRYSTTGASGNKNIHPILFPFRARQAAMAHNGNLVRLKKLRDVVAQRGGYNFEGTTDTEFIAALISTSPKETFLGALLETLPLLDGAFSLVLLYDDTVYAVKDRFSIRPLCVGKAKDAYIAASETCALDIVKAKFLKELGPGEGAILKPDGIEYFTWYQGGQIRRCVFDPGVYFSRPDSYTYTPQNSAKQMRKTSGRTLGQKHPVPHADIVVPVPDSGNAPAEGYAEAQGLPVVGAILRPHPLGRTFIEAVVELRHEYRGLKYNPIRSDIEGKVVVVVDDSIIRGTTIPYIVFVLTLFGAKEIHVRIAAPPLRYPCHLGVDLPWAKDFIANRVDEHGNVESRSVEEIRQELERQAQEFAREFEQETGVSLRGVGLETLAYLSLEDLILATGLRVNSFCTGCFDQNYPVRPEEGSYNPKEISSK